MFQAKKNRAYVPKFNNLYVKNFPAKEDGSEFNEDDLKVTFNKRND